MALRSPIPNFAGITGFDDMQGRFIDAARSILLGYQLEYDGRHRWPITTLELYLHHHTKWPDPTAHAVRFPNAASARQLESGTWYVHRAMHPAPDPMQTYGWGLGPDRSGIDITAGIQVENISVGILIAGIGAKDGSATALKQIVRADAQDRMSESKWSPADKAILARINGTSVERGPLKLVASDMVDSPVWIGARKGLPATLAEPFKGSLLRLTTKERSPVPMRRLG